MGSMSAIIIAGLSTKFERVARAFTVNLFNPFLLEPPMAWCDSRSVEASMLPDAGGFLRFYQEAS